jgi:hypothetical protein
MGAISYAFSVFVTNAIRQQWYIILTRICVYMSLIVVWMLNIMVIVILAMEFIALSCYVS